MRLLLDTVTFIWAASTPERLSQRALAALGRAGAVLEISALSLAEISIKQSIGKLDLRREDVLATIEELTLRVLPYTSDHAWILFSLPLHHRDPFDRLVIAQALAEDIPVVTPDAVFKLYDGLRVIW